MLTMQIVGEGIGLEVKITEMDKMIFEILRDNSNQ